MNLKSVLGLHSSAQLMAYWMPWTGNPSRVSYDVGYRQDDSVAILRQVDCMKAVGIDGVIACWQGSQKAFTHDAFTKMFYTCLKEDMPFLVLLDQWIAKQQTNPTQAVINELTSPFFKGMAPFMAKKWVMEFDLAAPDVGVNLAQVQTALNPLGLSLLSKHKDYSWPETSNTMATLALDNKNTLMKVPCIFSGFFDGGYPLPGGISDPGHWLGQRDWNASVWNSPADYANPQTRKPARIIPERGGLTFQQSVALLPLGAEFVGIVTWNDYDEHTSIEPGCRIFSGL